MGQINKIQGRLLRLTARDRVLVVMTAMAIAGTISGWFMPWQHAVLISWITGAIIFLIWVWGTIANFDAQQTKQFALIEDSSRASAEVLLIVACTASLFGVAFELAKASQSSGGERIAQTAMAALTLAISWTVVHSVFTLRYAHEYYTDPIGGINFKNSIPPDFQDFAYVAFTVGMTFQVSDTDITSPTIRRTIIRHAILAYVFGAVILAVMVNVGAALLQG